MGLSDLRTIIDVTLMCLQFCFLFVKKSNYIQPHRLALEFSEILWQKTRQEPNQNKTKEKTQFACHGYLIRVPLLKILLN